MTTESILTILALVIVAAVAVVAWQGDFGGGS